MNSTVDELADWLTERHAMFFKASPQSEINQTVFVEQEDGGGQIIACGWGSAEEREAILIALREEIAACNAVRYSAWAETWISSTGGKDKEQVLRDFRPGDAAKDPNRKEGVVTIVVARDGQQASRLQMIERDAKGHVARLTMDKDSGILPGFGALANLFPPGAAH